MHRVLRITRPRAQRNTEDNIVTCLIQRPRISLYLTIIVRQLLLLVHFLVLFVGGQQQTRYLLKRLTITHLQCLTANLVYRKRWRQLRRLQPNRRTVCLRLHAIILVLVVTRGTQRVLFRLMRRRVIVVTFRLPRTHLVFLEFLQQHTLTVRVTLLLHRHVLLIL